MSCPPPSRPRRSPEAIRKSAAVWGRRRQSGSEGRERPGRQSPGVRARSHARAGSPNAFPVDTKSSLRRRETRAACERLTGIRGPSAVTIDLALASEADFPEIIALTNKAFRDTGPQASWNVEGIIE